MEMPTERLIQKLLSELERRFRVVFHEKEVRPIEQPSREPLSNEPVEAILSNRRNDECDSVDVRCHSDLKFIDGDEIRRGLLSRVTPPRLSYHERSRIVLPSVHQGDVDVAGPDPLS